MSRSSGTYSLPLPPVVTGTTISSTWVNSTLSDIATEITNSLPRDGQAAPTANIPMGGYKLTNMGNGSARTDSASLGQIQDSAYLWLSSVSGSDTITATVTPNATAYAAGQSFWFVAAGTNTGAVTININSIGAKSITKQGSTVLGAGDIVANAVYQITYDGTRFQLMSANVGGLLTGSGYTMATGKVLGRTTASVGAVEELSASGVLDLVGTPAQGDVAYRGASAWALLPAGTSGQLLKTGGAGANPAWASAVTAITSTAVTSGTSVDVTGIPSWATIVEITVNGVSTNGTSPIQFQIGVGSTPDTSSYTGSCTSYGGGTVSTHSTGFVAAVGVGAADALYGTVRLVKHTGNTWICASTLAINTGGGSHGGGVHALSGSLGMVRITTVGGVNTFDGSGSMTVMYM